VGLKLNEVELMKGTDRLRGRPTTLFAGSPVDRNAGFGPDVSVCPEEVADPDLDTILTSADV
jgi:hypothetical protein